MNHTPRVSIGVPVYNGERFLRETLMSLRTQTFEDFEIVISDNASTDGTRDICDEFAQMDGRIRYFREEENRGAAWNYNRVVELARGRYFKWAAHDDLCARTYLERCVEVLDRDPSVVLAHTDDQDIDRDGTPVDRKRRSHIPSAERARSPRASQRFRNLIRLDYDCEQVFGVIRLDVLRGTRLIGKYTDSDRTLLAQLGLYGKFHEVPEPLFLHRHHEDSSCRANPITGGWHERAAWFDPRLGGAVLYPQWRQLREYLRVIMHAPISAGEKFRCLFWIAVMYRLRVVSLAQELLIGMRRSSWRRREMSATKPGRTGREKMLADVPSGSDVDHGR